MRPPPADEQGGGPPVSVVLPAYQEVAAIAGVVEGVRAALGDGCEVIVVDDGSTDGTGARAMEAGAHVIPLWPNRGKGAAIRAGLAAARGAVVVLLDSDGQDEPREIPVLLDALRDEVIMVVGSRFLGRFEAGAITPTNRLGNRLLSMVVSVLYRARLTDTQAGFRAFRRGLLAPEELSAEGYDIEVDLLLTALESGGDIVEVPVTRRPRHGGRSGLAPLRDGMRILARIISRRLRWRDPGGAGLARWDLGE